MNTKDLVHESSGYSLDGSYTPDLIYSKLWLARELNRILTKFNIESIPVAYILGSWYGNLAIILRKAQLPIDKIVDVEKNAQWLEMGQQLQQQMNISGVESMLADANKIDYRQLRNPALVINTSVNDMQNRGWFENIPTDTLVVIQGRNAVSFEADYSYNTPKDLLLQYPLDVVFYQGSLDLTDPETDYRRSMIIGIKRR